MGFPGHCLLPAGRPRGRSSAACSGAGYTRIPILLAWLWEPPCASAELCQERVDSRVEEGAIYDIEEQLHTRDTSPAALQRFLLAVPLACLAALQRGEDTLAPRCCKDTMMARIVEIMEDSPPPLVLADCLNAACSLSTLQPPLRAQLLSPLLTAAVGQTVSGDWQQEPIHTQQFIRALPYDLQALLASLLAESPDTARLQLIMEHLSPWLESRLPQERARALGSTTALLGVATTLPGFDNSADWPRMGHHVAQLGLFISDPSEDVSRLAREGVHSLYQLLLHHRGLNIHQAEDLWCRHYYKERWVLAHSNSVRVGEVFGQLFTAEQEKSFLDKALLAARSPLRRPSQAGLVLAHALHGQAHQLLEYMQEDTQ
ncbi:maestro heat-like repeat-containing protein family member 7 isoform X4 [Pelodiscus sinensis]|uniref:maestro heat-like repeat-containing protein family member 7 isoform X4 n=1 Tax=Pelodiscus sinensis TaxID=13735 RepID=UPI003F6B2D3B